MVTVREFAKNVGRSHVLILRLCERGVIPRNADGKIPLEEGLAAFDAYDKSPEKKPGRPKKDAKKGGDIVPKVTVPEEKNGQRKESVNIHAALTKANLAEKTFKAKLRELEFKIKSGEYLAKDEVKAEAMWVAEQVKTKLMAIPPRVSSMCEGRIAREIEEIITDALNNALKEFQNCKYIRKKDNT